MDSGLSFEPVVMAASVASGWPFWALGDSRSVGDSCFSSRCLPRQLHSLSRVNQLLGDIVEEVPATEGKRALQESQGKVTHRRCHPEREGIGGPQLFEVSWGAQMSGISTVRPHPHSLQHSQPCFYLGRTGQSQHQ